MIRLFMTGAWVCLITLAAAYGISQWVASGGKLMVRKDYLEGLEYEKTRMINVPMIVDGAVQGYISAQFVFTVDAKTVRQLSVPPDPFVVHEAFRRIYAEERIDFKNLKKQDLVPLLKGIKQDVNERMQANIVQDVLIEEFNYISKDDCGTDFDQLNSSIAIRARSAAFTPIRRPGPQHRLAVAAHHRWHVLDAHSAFCAKA